VQPNLLSAVSAFYSRFLVLTNLPESEEPSERTIMLSLNLNRSGPYLDSSQSRVRYASHILNLALVSQLAAFLPEDIFLDDIGVFRAEDDLPGTLRIIQEHTNSNSKCPFAVVFSGVKSGDGAQIIGGLLLGYGSNESEESSPITRHRLNTVFQLLPAHNVEFSQDDGVHEISIQAESIGVWRLRA
jgi:hypothetical protein